jgi:hypothetical protein
MTLYEPSKLWTVGITSYNIPICYCYCEHSSLKYNNFNFLDHKNIYKIMGASIVYKNNQILSLTENFYPNGVMGIIII